MAITRAGTETTLGISLLISSTEKSRLFSALPLLCLPERVNLLLGDGGTLLSCALLRLQDLHLHLQLQERKSISSSSTNKEDTRTAKGGGGDHDVLHSSDLSQDTDVKRNSSCDELTAHSYPSFPLQSLLPSPTFSPRYMKHRKLIVSKLLLLFQIFPQPVPH